MKIRNSPIGKNAKSKKSNFLMFVDILVRMNYKKGYTYEFLNSAGSKFELDLTRVETLFTEDKDYGRPDIATLGFIFSIFSSVI